MNSRPERFSLAASPGCRRNPTPARPARWASACRRRRCDIRNGERPACDMVRLTGLNCWALDIYSACASRAAHERHHPHRRQAAPQHFTASLDFQPTNAGSARNRLTLLGRTDAAWCKATSVAEARPWSPPSPPCRSRQGRLQVALVARPGSRQAAFLNFSKLVAAGDPPGWPDGSKGKARTAYWRRIGRRRTDQWSAPALNQDGGEIRRATRSSGK